MPPLNGGIEWKNEWMKGGVKQELSYRQQTARKLRTQYAEATETEPLDRSYTT